jgi:hypothetical protein
MGDGAISWGDGGAGSTYLCRAILEDIYHNREIATNFAQRLKHRTVIAWPKDQPHAITADEVIAHIDDMKRTAAEFAPIIERVSREKPMFVTDRPAPGQEYSANPTIKPNVAKETK